MVKWANALLSFSGFDSGGIAIGSAKVQPGDEPNITKDILYMAVSSNTTAAEWTAICLGKQDMMSMFAAANATPTAAGINTQTLQVVINVVSG